MKRLVFMLISVSRSILRKNSLIYAKYVVILLMLAIGTAGCDKEVGNSEISKKEFCSFVNEKNIDETIPIVNEFLDGLSKKMNDEQKLQALTKWLKSCPCVIDASIFRTVFSGFMQKTIAEILISFDENGITKELILDVSMTNSLEVTGYHDQFYPGNITVVTKTNFTMDMVFDFINSFENDVMYITGVCYTSTMPSDSLLYVAYGIRAKPYVVGPAYALHFMTNEITLNFWLSGMKDIDCQEDWLKTINDYQLVEIMNEERYEGYNIVFNVPEGTERQWETIFKGYEFIESIRLDYFIHN